MKKLCKKLKIKFENINLKNTHFKKKVLPNSSFKKRIRYFQNKEKDFKPHIFPSNKLPKNYSKIYKKVIENSY